MGKGGGVKDVFILRGSYVAGRSRTCRWLAGSSEIAMPNSSLRGSDDTGLSYDKSHDQHEPHPV